MSSLAGALGESIPSSFATSKQGMAGNYASEDVEMDDFQELNDENKDEHETMDDLFGNDEDDEAKDEGSGSPGSQADSDRLPSPERERRHALEYEEDENPPDLAMEEVKEANVSFPNLPVPHSSDGNTWVMRMPNYVRVDSKPFHPDTYVGPEHEDEDVLHTESVREKSMSIKLQVENTVRWRWTKDEAGLNRRQSNGRIIRWSDGTLSLRLGKELFDINQTVDTSAGVPRQFIGSQSSQPTASQADLSGKGQGLTYLVAQHKRSQVLQAEAVITGQMTLRPTGMQSETHRMLVRAVGQKHTKVAKLRMAPDPTTDPEREHLELIKQSAKQSKKKREPSDGLGRRRKKPWQARARNPYSDDEEEDAGIFGEDSDDEGDEAAGYASHRKKRSDKEPSGYQEDDFLVADDSEEDDAFSGAKRRKKAAAAEGTEDELDRLEAKIEQDARRDTTGGDSDNKEGDMDVESEEESDEDQVRRVKGPGRRKAPVFDEDEDE